MELKAPGESLLIRLVESVEKGVGALTRPWQIRREGAARADVEVLRELKLGAARALVQRARAGEPEALRILMGENPEFGTLSAQVPRDEGADSGLEVIELASRDAALARIDESLNVLQAAQYAAEALPSDAGERAAPDAFVSDDWLRHWRNHAKLASADDLQLLWGEVLAGEVSAPGSFSLRTLHTLGTLSRGEAELVRQVAPFTSLHSALITGVSAATESPGMKLMKDRGVSLENLLRLEEIGIISGVTGSLNLEFDSNTESSFNRLLGFWDVGMIVRKETAKASLRFDVIAITPVGMDILRLVRPQADPDYLRLLASQLAGLGFDVALVDIAPAADAKTWIAVSPPRKV